MARGVGVCACISVSGVLWLKKGDLKIYFFVCDIGILARRLHRWTDGRRWRGLDKSCVIKLYMKFGAMDSTV